MAGTYTVTFTANNALSGTAATVITVIDPLAAPALMGPGDDLTAAEAATPTQGVPREFALRQNYPNPFNARTGIRFELPRSGRVYLRVFDVRGRVVRTLVNGDLPPGVHQAHWDARDDGGRRVSSGVYLVKLEAKGFTSTRKIHQTR
jgi:hypothetical protein